MYRFFSFAATAALTLAVFFQAAPVSALSCAMSYPTIGTIGSVTSTNGYSTFTLNYADAYDSSALGVNTGIGSTINLDLYGQLARDFIQNNYRVSGKYARQLNQYETADQVRSSLGISVQTEAIAKMSYQTGDVIIMGPPAGGTCSQYGVVAVFSKEGTIKSLEASNPSYNGYSLSGEFLSLNPSADTNCVTNSYGGSLCQVPITYSISGTSQTLNPGETRTFPGTKFNQISVITSTHTQQAPNMPMMSGVNPTTFNHVIVFAPAQTASVSFAAYPTSGVAPLTVRFTGIQGWGGIDFGDGTQGDWQDGIPTYIDHAYATPGFYTAKLQSSTGNLGTVTISVTDGRIEPPRPGLSCPVLLRTLSVGSRGLDVIALQDFLIAQGFLSAGNNSGYFGRMTKAAVIAFQSAYDLPTTGLVGRLTRAAISEVCGQ